jgi:hypothetical protein
LLPARPKAAAKFYATTTFDNEIAMADPMQIELLPRQVELLKKIVEVSNLPSPDGGPSKPSHFLMAVTGAGTVIVIRPDYGGQKNFLAENKADLFELRKFGLIAWAKYETSFIVTARGFKCFKLLESRTTNDSTPFQGSIGSDHLSSKDTEIPVESFLEALKAESLSSTGSIVELLRKALVVATTYGDNAFRKWVELELDGYPNDPVPNYLPGYRIIAGTPKFQVQGGIWREASIKNAKLRRTLSRLSEVKSIAEIEGFFRESQEDYRIYYPLDVQEEIARLKPGLELTLHCDRSTLANILESVRNKVQRWALNLIPSPKLENQNRSSQESRAAQSSPTETVPLAKNNEQPRDLAAVDPTMKLKIVGDYASIAYLNKPYPLINEAQKKIFKAYFDAWRENGYKSVSLRIDDIKRISKDESLETVGRVFKGSPLLEMLFKSQPQQGFWEFKP